MPSSPSGSGKKSAMRAAVPTGATLSTAPPASAPAAISTTPNPDSSRMQRRTISTYRGSKMRSGSGPPGYRTAFNGKSGISAEMGGLPEALLEGSDELAVQAAEAAVAHDQHLIARMQGPGEIGRELAYVLRQPPPRP